MLASILIPLTVWAMAAAGFAATFAEPIEKAHGMAAYRSKQALQTGILVEFEGRKSLEGTLLFEIDSERSRIETSDGQVLVWDGEEAWVGPNALGEPVFRAARFHLRTWTYFLALPMKLRDAGAHLADAGSMPFDGRRLPAARLTFGETVGDTPDDWYLVHVDPATSRVAGLAYIVTYFASKEKAEEEPHAIVYEEYREIDGVALSTKWAFKNWSEEQGIHGEPLGRAVLTDARFVTPPPDAFLRPDGAKADPLPGS